MDTAAIDVAKLELMKDNEAFRDMVVRHQEYEQRLTELADLHYPTEDEQMEEHLLKKKKLALKDEIYAMMEQYDRAH
jgi:uncharacterized protein YdcH (DUF465 family)